MAKKAYNPLAILDRLKLIPIIKSEYDVTSDIDEKTVVFNASLIKRSNPAFRVNLYTQESQWDGTVNASLTYPNKLGTSIEPEWNRSINVSVEKDISKIIADIEKRLLPDYEEYLAECLKNEAQRQDYRDREAKARQDLIDRGIATDFRGEFSYLGDEYKKTGINKLRVTGETVQFEMAFISVEKAIKLAEFLKGL